MEDLSYDSISYEECQDAFGKIFGVSAKVIYCNNVLIFKFKPEEYKKYNRDYFRSPMQWDKTPNAGFTHSNVKTWLPIHSNYSKLNVQVKI